MFFRSAAYCTTDALFCDLGPAKMTTELEKWLQMSLIQTSGSHDHTICPFTEWSLVVSSQRIFRKAVSPIILLNTDHLTLCIHITTSLPLFPSMIETCRQKNYQYSHLKVPVQLNDYLLFFVNKGSNAVDSYLFCKKNTH